MSKILYIKNFSYLYILFSIMFLACFANSALSLAKDITDNIGKVNADTIFLDKFGTQVKLSDFKGKVVILHFWASWCTNCIPQLKSLDQLQKEFPENLKVIALSEDYKNISSVESVFAQKKIKNLDIYSDIKLSMFSAHHIQSIPSTIVIDQHSKLILALSGDVDWSDDYYSQLVEDQAREDE